MVLCGQSPGVEEHPSLHVESHVGQRDRRFRTCQADGAHHEPHAALEFGEDVLDMAAHRRFLRIGPGGRAAHRLAGGNARLDWIKVQIEPQGLSP